MAGSGESLSTADVSTVRMASGLITTDLKTATNGMIQNPMMSTATSQATTTAISPVLSAASSMPETTFQTRSAAGNRLTTFAERSTSLLGLRNNTTSVASNTASFFTNRTTPSMQSTDITTLDASSTTFSAESTAFTFPSTTMEATESTIQTALNQTVATNTALTENAGFQFEIWQIIVIAVACAFVLIVFIVFVICCAKKKKKNYEVKKQKKMDELWSVETGGAEVPMVNISASQKAWRGSTDSIDDKITTAGVVNPSNVPVNVFAPSSKSTSLARAISNASAQSKSSAESEKSSITSSQKLKPIIKPKKPLTKVEMPIIGGNGEVKRKSASDLTGDDDTASDVNSVFSDTPRTPTSGVSGFLAGKNTKNSEKKDAAVTDESDLPPPPPPPPSD